MNQDIKARYTYLFSNMPDSFIDGRDEYRWSSVPDIPDCQKYKIDPNIPIKFKSSPGQEGFIKIILPIWDVLSSLKEDALLLKPFRWDRIKSQLAKGEIEYPEASFDNSDPIIDLMNPNAPSIRTEERISLTDGRHRLVALMRFYNVTEAPFLCEPDHYEKIVHFLNKSVQEV